MECASASAGCTQETATLMHGPARPSSGYSVNLGQAEAGQGPTPSGAFPPRQL